MSAQRRSFAQHRLEQAGATFAEVGGAPVAVTVSAEDDAVARRLGLADISLLPRAGYKGAGAPAWLRQQNVTLPPQPNTAQPQADGTLAAALSAQEHLLLSPLAGGGLAERLPAQWSLDDAPQCYQLPRADSHFWFALTGARSGDALAKLCGADLRPPKFPVNAIAQTSVARVSAIVIRRDSKRAPLFYLLADSASADYMWGCLQDAMNEFSGAAIGLNALRALAE